MALTLALLADRKEDIAGIDNIDIVVVVPAPPYGLPADPRADVAVVACVASGPVELRKTGPCK